MSNDRELPEITEEDRQFLHYNPNTGDIVDWARQYARRAIIAAAVGPNRYVIVQHIGCVPERKGPFNTADMMEAFLREAYTIYPDVTCVVVSMPDTEYPQHGREWLAMYGDQRRKRLPAAPKQSPVGNLVVELVKDCDRAVKQAGGTKPYETCFREIVQRFANANPQLQNRRTVRDGMRAFSGRPDAPLEIHLSLVNGDQWSAISNKSDRIVAAQATAEEALALALSDAGAKP